MKRALLVLTLSLSLAGCGTLTRLMSYGTELSDAVVPHGGRTYAIYIHPKDDTLLMQMPVASGTGRAAIAGLSLGVVNTFPSAREYRLAAEHFLSPTPCTLTALDLLDRDSGSYEASFACPEGFDLRPLAADQRAALRAGSPLVVTAGE